MFCPKCSQEIASNDLRFCPRCGLPLLGITDLLASNGLTKVPEQPSTGLNIFKRKEYRLSAQLVFFSIFAIPIAIVFSIVFDSPFPLAIPLFLFLAGLARLTYTFLFGKGLGASNTENQAQFSYAPPQGLNEYREYVSPIENFGRAKTNELARPPSVTERTTNLLKEEASSDD
jgi:hypothetical protein